MGTTSARLAALSFATLTIISIGAILLTFARMIQPGDAETIMGMNVNLWYIFAATAAIASFALFALFTTLDSIRESNERIADVLEDMDTLQPADDSRPATPVQAPAAIISAGSLRFRVTGIDRASGMQTSVIVEAKDKAEATLRARDKGVRDLSRVEYIRRSTTASLRQQAALQVPSAQPSQPAQPPDIEQTPVVQTTPSRDINLPSSPGSFSPLPDQAPPAETSATYLSPEEAPIPVSQLANHPTTEA